MKKANRSVSIVIATIKPRAYFENLVASISLQDLKPHQVVVVDSSPDGTVQKTFETHNVTDILTYVQQPPSGIYEAWNLALKHVTGNLVWFIGDDDILSPGTIKGILSVVNTPEMSLQKTFLIPVRRDSHPVIFNPEQLWQFKHGTPKTFEHSGFICSLCLFREYGNFSEEYRIAGDYDWLLRIYLSSNLLNNISRLNDCPPLIKGATGISSKDKRKIFREFRQIRNRHSLPSYTAFDFFIDLRQIGRRLFVQTKNQTNLGLATRSSLADS